MKRCILILTILTLTLAGDIFGAGERENDTASAAGNTAAGGRDSGEFAGGSAPVVTVEDSKGVTVAVRQPVESIVSINSGMSEILAALGAADRITGRCSYSTFPSTVRECFVVAKNSSSPNLESILRMEPDLVLADAMFDESARDLLANRGIPVMIESTSDPEYLPELVEKIGRVIGEEDRAAEVLAAVTEYEAEVGDFVAAAQAAGAEKPPVYFENRKTYKSTNRSTGHHRSIELAGGINIAADEPVRSPVLSPEYIVRRNPEVIVRRVSGDAGPDALGKMLETIYNRPSLQSVDAVAEGNVHIIKSDLFIALRYPVGTAYFASWFYPEHTGLDPEDLHRRLITSLYGGEEWEKVLETYVYP